MLSRLAETESFSNLGEKSTLSKPSQQLASQNGRPGSREETLIGNVDEVVVFNNAEIRDIINDICLLFSVSILMTHGINFETRNLTIQLVTTLFADSTSFAEPIKKFCSLGLEFILCDQNASLPGSPGILLQSLLAGVWEKHAKTISNSIQLMQLQTSSANTLAEA